MTQYDAYAALYDRSGQIRFSLMMDLYLQDLLRHHPVVGRQALDLGCGTGTLALLLAERGWRVTGIDRAPAMLREARRKAARVPAADVRFLEGDLRDFTLDSRVDLVTSCYDTLNYLLHEDDLRRCCAAVARVLAPGGLFCFDLASDYFLRHYWNGVEIHEFSDFSLIMQSRYDDASSFSTLVLTGFERVAAERYRRFREVHIERAYEETTVRSILAGSGLRVEAVYDCFTTQPPRPHSLRLMYVARLDGQAVMGDGSPVLSDQG
jgi:SAM-dependent methyltransferase